MKKQNDGYDQEEDYSGPMGGSYFVPSKERDEQGRPLRLLTRKEAREERAREEEARWATLGAFADGVAQQRQQQVGLEAEEEVDGRDVEECEGQQ